MAGVALVRVDRVSSQRRLNKACHDCLILFCRRRHTKTLGGDQVEYPFSHQARREAKDIPLFRPRRPSTRARRRTPAPAFGFFCTPTPPAPPHPHFSPPITTATNTTIDTYLPTYYYNHITTPSLLARHTAAACLQKCDLDTTVVPINQSTNQCCRSCLLSSEHPKLLRVSFLPFLVHTPSVSRSVSHLPSMFGSTHGRPKTLLAPKVAFVLSVATLPSKQARKQPSSRCRLRASLHGLCSSRASPPLTPAFPNRSFPFAQTGARTQPSKHSKG